MINFRYHVVSLIAIFLALGIGVLFGASFIAESTVRFLEENQNRLGERNRNLNEDLSRADDAIERLTSFSRAARPLMVEQMLTSVPVLVMSFESTDEGLTEEVEAALAESGANVTGSLVLSGRLDLATDARRQSVALALNVTATAEEAVRPHLFQAFERLLRGESAADIASLVDSGLVRVRSVPGSVPVADMARPGTVGVFVAPSADSEPVIDRLAVPLTESLAAAGLVIAAADPQVTDLSYVGPLRESGARVVTVDGAAQAPGQIALILGVAAALNGSYGHYGSGEGASRPLPERAVLPARRGS